MPALRFEGFGGEWASSELGKLLDITSAARVHKNEWTDAGVPFFRTSDVVSIYKGQENKKAYISLELYKELSARSGIVRKDDLLITGGGSIGIPYLITTVDPMYFKDADLLWLKNTTGTNGYLLFTFFSSPPFRKYINSITHIGTISHYTIEQAKTTPIHISKESEEQTKIGNYFQQLDTLIAQHQQKHDKLLNLKKSLLEKMFPKQGATVPEIRFNGFSGEWEKKEVQEVANRYDNLRIPITATDRISGSTPYYGANGIQGYVEGQTHDGEFILVAEDGANDLKNYPVQYVNGKIWVNNHAHVLQAKNNIADNYFLKLSISHTEIEAFLVGGGRAKLNSETMMKIVIDISSKNGEQTKIGNLFKQLDTLLTQHQAQLKKLNNIKQACLEKMFV